MDIIINGKVHKEELAQVGWINKNDFQCYCSNVIKNVGKQFDVRYKKGTEKAKIRKEPFPIHIEIICKECYREYKYLTFASDEDDKKGIGFGLWKEDIDLLESMDETEKKKFISERTKQVISERKFHTEWSPIAIEQITEFEEEE